MGIAAGATFGETPAEKEDEALSASGCFGYASRRIILTKLT